MFFTIVRPLHTLLLLTLVFFHFVSSCNAFTFSFSKPTQCDDLAVSWEGGQPPFRFLIVPPGGTIQNYSIPSDAFQDNKGTFSTRLQLSENQRVFFSMSDATGITAGGISDVSTVGASVTGNFCDLMEPGVDFFFSLDDDLSQCKPYPFTRYTGAIQPITILVLIPLGESFFLHPPIGDSFTWTPNVTAGTPISFTMTDSQGRIGGTSSIRVTKITNDTSCITTTTTSSSTVAPSQTSVPSPQATASHPNNSNLGLIIGVSVGSFGCLVVAAFLVYLCFFRRRSIHLRNIDLTYDPAGSPAPDRATYLLPDYYSSTPLSLHTSPSFSTSHPHQPSVEPFSPVAGSSSMYQSTHLDLHPDTIPVPFPIITSPANSDSQHGVMSPSRKSSRGGASLGVSTITSPVESTSSRVIVHTDIAETMQLPIELPPQYSENLAPLPESYGLTPSASSSANSRTNLLSGNREKRR